MSHRIRLCCSVVAATFVAGLAAPAVAAPLDLAQNPLFIGGRVPPAFILAVDDSGSMDSEILLRTNDGASWWRTATRSFIGLDENDQPQPGRVNFNRAGGANNDWKKFTYLFPNGHSGANGGARLYADTAHDHFAAAPIPAFAYLRAPEYNTQYFDPAHRYLPWLAANGQPFFNAAQEGRIDPTNAPSDPYRPALRMDLTQNFALSGRNSEFRLYRGAEIQGPVRIRIGDNHFDNNDTNANCAGTNLPTQRNQWVNVPAGTTITITSNNNAHYCRIAFEYYPATFYVSEAGRDAMLALLGYDPAALIPGGTSPSGAPLYGFEIRPANFTGGGLGYTETMQRFANWFSYYRKRQHATIAGMSRAFAGDHPVRTGYFTINNRTAVTMRDLTDAGDKTAFYNQFLALRANGGTPNKEAVLHLGNQFRRTGAGAPVQYACQVNAGLLFTDGFSNSTFNFNVGNVDGGQHAVLSGPPFQDDVANTMADIASSFYVTNLRPDQPEWAGRMRVPAGCGVANPDPRLNCQRDLHMTFYGITMDTAGQIFNVDEAATEDPFANPPAWPSAAVLGNNRHPSAVDDIWHATINTRGDLLNARSAGDLERAFRDILSSVLDDSRPSGSLALTGARVNSHSFTVAPAFTVADNGRDWTGELIAVRLQADGTPGTTLWNASEHVPPWALRNILVASAGGTRAQTVGHALNSANLGATPAAQWDALGVSQAMHEIEYPGATPAQVLDYLRGDPSLERRNGGSFRDRSGALGDIVNSIPEIVSPKDDYGYRFLPGTAGATYGAYVASKASLPPMVYVGANAGMVHAFNGDSGAEEFAFVPNAMLGDRRNDNPGNLRNLGSLASEFYEHSYFNDGPITVADAWIGGWRTILVGTSGAGARTVYAIDVTAPTGVGPDDILWEINSHHHDDIGHVTGKPVMVPVEGGKWMAIFGNGYNSNSGRAALMMIDVQTGEPVSIVADPAGTENNGLGNIVVLDSNSDGHADTVYGGDLLGNVWKFRIDSSGGSVAFDGEPLFVARDSGGQRQPITGGFDVSAGPGAGQMLYFGTGRYLANNDNVVGANPPVQSFYAVWDNGLPAAGGRESLQRQEIVAQQTVDGHHSRNITDHATNFVFQRGWYLDLRIEGASASGERFIGTPRLQSGQVFFTSFEPIGDPCEPGGRNWMYGLNALTGAAALSNVAIGAVDGAPACPGGGCGSIGIADGAPVRETVLSIPPPASIPGLDCVIGEPGCEVPGELGDVYSRCTLMVQAAGSPPIFVPRPCGRQSWRHVR